MSLAMRARSRSRASSATIRCRSSSSSARCHPDRTRSSRVRMYRPSCQGNTAANSITPITAPQSAMACLPIASDSGTPMPPIVKNVASAGRTDSIRRPARQANGTMSSTGHTGTRPPKLNIMARLDATAAVSDSHGLRRVAATATTIATNPPISSHGWALCLLSYSSKATTGAPASTSAVLPQNLPTRGNGTDQGGGTVSV